MADIQVGAAEPARMGQGRPEAIATLHRLKPGAAVRVGASFPLAEAFTGRPQQDGRTVGPRLRIVGSCDFCQIAFSAAGVGEAGIIRCRYCLNSTLRADAAAAHRFTFAGHDFYPPYVLPFSEGWLSFQPSVLFYAAGGKFDLSPERKDRRRCPPRTYVFNLKREVSQSQPGRKNPEKRADLQPSG